MNKTNIKNKEKEEFADKFGYLRVSSEIWDYFQSKKQQWIKEERKKMYKKLNKIVNDLDGDFSYLQYIKGRYYWCSVDDMWFNFYTNGHRTFIDAIEAMDNYSIEKSNAMEEDFRNGMSSKDIKLKYIK